MRLAPSNTDAELARRFRTRIAVHIRRHAETLDTDARQRLLAQFTPDARELESVAGFDDDPLHEEDADIHPFADVIHKYRAKILYLATDECPVYCRYCTRKRKTLLSNGHAATPLAAIVAYLRAYTEVCEVIFSGGDPLMLPARDLFHRAGEFASVASIRFIRLHSRAVTTAPQLLNERWFNACREFQKAHATIQLALVLHVNTAAELSFEAIQKIQLLKEMNISLYAQSVLLAGINDNAAILSELCVQLVRHGVQPYYLHQLDRVTGSAHFEVPDANARGIYNELKNLIPAYMLPRFVRDSKQGKFSM